MPDFPKNWTAIAVFSRNEHRWIALPNVCVSPDLAHIHPQLQCHEVTKSGRKFLEVRAK